MWDPDYKESWALKIWCFWTVILEKTLKSPLDCGEINQSILKEISLEYSLEGLMLKLKLQYFGHLMWRTDSFEETLMLGKIEGGKRRGWQRKSPSLTWWTWVWVNSRSWWWTGKPGMLQSMGLQRVRHDWVTELNHEVIYHCLSGSPEGLAWDRFLSPLDSDKMWGSLPWLPWNRAEELSVSRITQLHSHISSHGEHHNMNHPFPFISG